MPTKVTTHNKHILDGKQLDPFEIQNCSLVLFSWLRENTHSLEKNFKMQENKKNKAKTDEFPLNGLLSHNHWYNMGTYLVDSLLTVFCI